MATVPPSPSIEESSAKLSTISVPPQENIPSPFPSGFADDVRPYVHNGATPLDEAGKSDMLLRPSTTSTPDVDNIFPQPSQDLMLRGGGTASPRSSALSKEHHLFVPSLLSHSHPLSTFSPRRLIQSDYEVTQSTGLPMKDVRVLAHSHEGPRSNAIDEKGAAIVVTASGHHSTESEQCHDLASNPVETNDNGMIADPSGRLTPPAHETDRVHSAPSGIIRPTNGPDRRNELIANPVVPDDNVIDITTASRINNTYATPLRQSHLNALLTSLIPSAPSCPRQNECEKLNDETVDPFDNFNSGSEQEDEADVDFKGRTASASVRSKSYSSSAPTPSESDREPSVRGRVKAATVQKPRTSGNGDWPIAIQARKRNVIASDSQAPQTERCSYSHDDHADGSVTWPVGTEAAKAADRGVAVSGILTYTNGDNDRNSMDPNMEMSTGRKYATTPDNARMGYAKNVGARKRLLDQMLEADAEVVKEAQRLKEVERESERPKSMEASTRSSRNMQGISTQGHEDSEVRNGSGWTLVVKKDRHGGKVMKWKIC
ncbi:MAG: hypothetical protein Q9209_001721 [Squamulea sp. 1 TL-2023]